MPLSQSPARVRAWHMADATSDRCVRLPRRLNGRRCYLPKSSITISPIAGEAGVVGIYVGMRGALMILSKEIQTSKDLLRCPLAHHFLTIFNILSQNSDASREGAFAAAGADDAPVGIGASSFLPACARMSAV